MSGRWPLPALPFFVAILVSLAHAAATAQSQAPSGRPTSFDVVSVKRTSSPASPLEAMKMGAGGISIRPGGRVVAPSTTVRQLLMAAYAVEEGQISGGPSWIGRDRFQIEAKTIPDVSADEARVMVRQLLEDRFNLTIRMEPRTMPVYLLLVARPDRLGKRLRSSASECAPLVLPSGLAGPAVGPLPPAPTNVARPLSLSSLSLPCGSSVLAGHMSLRAVTMPLFAQRLTTVLGRPVIDRTNLSGAFDLDLTYAADNQTPAVAQPNDAPSPLTAVTEQLGLRLESSTMGVDTLVIDRIDPPTEN